MARRIGGHFVGARLNLLASSFTATAAVSVPAAVGGLAVAQIKDATIDFGCQKIIEYSRAQGKNSIESQKFAETTDWMIGKIKNIYKIFNFTKLVQSPKAPFYDAKSVIKETKELSKYAKIAFILDQNSRINSKEQKSNMLLEVLSKIENK